MRRTEEQKIWHEAWQCISDEQTDKAKELFDRLQNANHNIPDLEILQLRIAILAQKGNHSDALALLKPVAGQFPNDHHISFSLAWNLAKLQKWDEAIVEYRRGLSLPDVPDEDRSAVEEAIEHCENQLESQQER